MEEEIKTPVESQAVLEFIRVAWEYVMFFEKDEKVTTSDIMTFLQKVGPLLYLKANLLPSITPEFPEALEHFVTEEEWENLFNSLREEFGTNDIFWFVDPDIDADFEPIKASLAEHVTDIYQDLKDFILLYQKNLLPVRENAVFDIHRLFKHRWGPALLRILSHIHRTLFPTKQQDEYESVLD